MARTDPTSEGGGMTAFDPATASWEERAQVAEAILRSLSNAVEGYARDNGNQLPHRLNLPGSVAANHVRLIDAHLASATPEP